MIKDLLVCLLVCMVSMGGGGERGEREEKFKWRSLKERSKAFHIVVPLTFPIKTLN